MIEYKKDGITYKVGNWVVVIKLIGMDEEIGTKIGDILRIDSILEDSCSAGFTGSDNRGYLWSQVKPSSKEEEVLKEFLERVNNI